MFWLLCPLVAVAAESAATGAMRTPRRNVLFIMVDDLKPVLGTYGDRLAVTPHMDQLAARGVRFDRAYANQAVCAPSRNALMTASRPTSVGIYDLATNFREATPDAVTLAQRFMHAGWRTESVGKIMHPWHGNFEDAASWSVPHWIPRAPVYADPANLALQQRRIEAERSLTNGIPRGEPGAAGYKPGTPKGLPVESADVPDEAYDDGRVAAEAIRRLQAAAQREDAPWFLAVGFYRPHLPFNAPKKYWDLHERARMPLAAHRSPPEGAPGYAGVEWGELRAYIGMPQQGALTDDQQRELIHGYYASVSYVDAQIGRVLAEVKRLGLSSNTIIVLWGDHGFHLGDHGFWCKHSNYEEAVRTPLIISVPGAARGAASATLVEAVDLYPTLVELAALPAAQVPQPFDGRSFAAALREPAAQVRTAAFHVYPRTNSRGEEVLGRAVRTDRYRLVEWKQPNAAATTAEYELYDYLEDPAETKNLAATRPALLRELLALLSAQPEARAQVKTKTVRPDIR